VDQRMGGARRCPRAKPWCRISAAGMVLPRRPRPFAGLDDRSGGIERWLYRVARRHAGHQPQGWAFELRHLYAKSGSAARFSDFALDLRRIAARQSLPGYDLFIELDSARKLLRVVPRRLSTGTVDGPVEAIRRSGAHAIRRSGATLSADQAHEPQLTLWPATRNGARNESNSKESNSSVVGGENLGIRIKGAARPSRPMRRQ
jgi:plasmid replication initiation protein